MYINSCCYFLSSVIQCCIFGGKSWAASTWRPWSRAMPGHPQTGVTEPTCVPVVVANCPDTGQRCAWVGCQITEHPRHTVKRDNKTTDNSQKICLIVKSDRVCRCEISLEFLACRGNSIYRGKIHRVSKGWPEGNLEKYLKFLYCSHGGGNSDPNDISR